MNEMVNQRRSDELSLKQQGFVVQRSLVNWILLSRKFSHHKQQTADVREMQYKKWLHW